MKTIKKESQKKQALMNAALDLMLEKGYVATTVDEICGQAEVTKGSFFHYFDSKETLGKELIEYFNFCTSESMGKNIGEMDDPLDRVYGSLDCAIKMSKDPTAKGCLIGVFAQELSKSHPELRSLCCTSFDMKKKELEKDLMAAKEKYAPDASIDITGLAESFMATVQGAMILMKASQDRGVVERTLKHYRKYLQSLFGR